MSVSVYLFQSYNSHTHIYAYIYTYYIAINYIIHATNNIIIVINLTILFLSIIAMSKRTYLLQRVRLKANNFVY